MSIDFQIVLMFAMGFAAGFAAAWPYIAFVWLPRQPARTLQIECDEKGYRSRWSTSPDWKEAGYTWPETAESDGE